MRWSPTPSASSAAPTSARRRYTRHASAAPRELGPAHDRPPRRDVNPVARLSLYGGQRSGARSMSAGVGGCHRVDDRAQAGSRELGVAAHRAVIESESLRGKHLGRAHKRRAKGLFGDEDVRDESQREKPWRRISLGLSTLTNVVSLCSVLVVGARDDDPHGPSAPVAEAGALLETDALRDAFERRIEPLKSCSANFPNLAHRHSLRHRAHVRDDAATARAAPFQPPGAPERAPECPGILHRVPRNRPPSAPESAPESARNRPPGAVGTTPRVGPEYARFLAIFEVVLGCRVGSIVPSTPELVREVVRPPEQLQSRQPCSAQAPHVVLSRSARARRAR